MQAEPKYIQKFLRSYDKLIIPVYQRNYDWKKENCAQLFSDIEKIASDKSSTHFIGTICTQAHNFSSSVIIDGQQRITSIMILLKALSNTVGNNKIKEKIECNFLFADEDDQISKLKLKPIKKDEAMFVKLMSASSFNEKDYTIKEKESNVYQNYTLFANKILESDATPEELVDAVGRLEIVELGLQNENPQVIFEGLNSTGLDLTNTDLIRNYLLMALEYSEQEDLYQKYWLPMEETIGNEKLEQFMLYYLIKKRKTNSITKNEKSARINEKNLYYSFKKTYPDINKLKSKNMVEDCLFDMHKHSVMYYDLISQTYYANDVLHQRFFELFTQLGANESAIFVMELYEQYNNEKITKQDFVDAMDVIITYVLRSKVCGQQGLSAQTASLSISRLENLQPSTMSFKDQIFEVLNINKGSYAFPKDATFEKDLLHINFYKTFRSSGCRYFLEKIEKYLSKETVSIDDATIEHIIPQTLSNEWVKYLTKHNDIENYDSILHTLGNLALTKYNSESSNHLFEQKREIYKTSNFIYTKQVAEYNDFTSNEISDRAEKISTIALKVWDLPEKYNQIEELQPNVQYTLDIPYTKFAFTKPDIFSLCGDEYTVNSWRDAWIQFNKILYNLDKKQYFTIMQSQWGDYLISNTKKNISQHEIETDKLLNTNLSSGDILSHINDILVQFDVENKTEFRDEFWIKIKK